MSHITAIVLTRDEAEHIADCLESLRFADRLLVFDSFSGDDTVAIAGAKGADVMQREFVNYAEQRNAALAAVAGDWALFVDADERVSPALASEIRQCAARDDYAGWQIPRHNYIFGRLTQGAGWYPDYQTRLLRIGQARYDPARPVHETVLLDGQVGTMQQPLVHHNYRDLAHFRDKQRRYVVLDARMLYAAGLRGRRRSLLSMPLRQFVWRFVSLQGYRDGWHGLRLCLLMAAYEFQKYRLLRRMELDSKAGAPHCPTSKP